jgi:pyruvate formate lyase activating enzyme
MKKLDIWVEVTTLVVPGQNDSPGELAQIAQFVAGVDRDIPWHISRYHPDYLFTKSPATPLETLHLALDIGKEAGLRYVYIGNIWGEADVTLCPECHKTVVSRHGYSAKTNIQTDNTCPDCGAQIAGVFSL